MGMLKPVAETSSINLAWFESESVFLANGSYVSDIMTTRSEEARHAIHNKTQGFEFFLIHNLTGDKTSLDNVERSMGDGYLGLTPGLGSGKDTYGIYLKKLGLISSNSFSVGFDYAEYEKSRNKQANLTFGVFNSSLNQSSLEEVKSNKGKGGYLIKSSGFSFNGTAFNFSKDYSFLKVDPFHCNSGYYC